MEKSSTDCMRKHSWKWYKELVDQCSNIHCSDISCLELHHIMPLCYGGEDRISNCIVLCEDCHRRLGLNLHSNWEDLYTILQCWKIKIDNSILDRMPYKYRKELIDSGLIIDEKLMREENESVEEIRNAWDCHPTSKEKENARTVFSYWCDHYDD